MPHYESYDFSGGVNKRLSPLVLLPNELADAQNVLPEERGSISRRYGFAAYNAVQAVADKKITGLLKFYGESVLSDVLVAACGTKLLSVPATGASTDLGATAGFTIDDGTDVFMAQHRERVYGTAWGATNKRMFVIATDPNTGAAAMAWPWGTTAPVNAAVVTAGASGSLTETHVLKYAYSFWYGEDGAHGESNTVTSAAFTVTATNSAIVTFFGASYDYLTAAAALNAGIDKVYIYRTATASDDLYFLKAITLADTGAGSALFWTDDGTESDGYPDDLDTNTTPESDHYPPDDAKYLAMHQTRAVTGNLHDGTDAFPQRVRWSLAGSPDIFPQNNKTDGASEHGEVKGIAELNGTIYIFYESAIAGLVLYGESDHLFQVVTTTAGVKAPKSLVVGKERGRDVAFFLSYDHQVYTFDGTNAYPISDDVNPVLTSDANQSYMHTCAGGWDGEYYYLSYPDGTDMVPSQELRYNTQVRKPNKYLGYDTGTWWPQVLPSGKAPNVYHQLAGATDAGELYWGNASATGWVFQHNSGNSDDGADISSMFQTGLNHLGSTAQQKALRDLLVDMRSWTYLMFRWDLDFDTMAGSFRIPSDPEVPEYDTGLYYDDGHYYVGEAPTRTKYPFTSVYEGMRFRVKVTGNEQNAPYKIYGWTVRFTPGREDKAS